MREQLPLESTNQLTTTFFEKIFVSCVVFLAWNCLASAAAALVGKILFTDST
jgi:hypothetical protein